MGLRLPYNAKVKTTPKGWVQTLGPALDAKISSYRELNFGTHGQGCATENLVFNNILKTKYAYCI